MWFFFYQERKDEAEDDNEWTVVDERRICICDNIWLEKKYNFDVFDVFYLRFIHFVQEALL